MKKRGDSYELSNLGEVTLPANTTGSKVRLQKLVFTQCGMVVGPAIGCGAVSLEGGPLTVSLYWQEGVLSDSFMKGLRDYLQQRLCGFAERK